MEEVPGFCAPKLPVFSGQGKLLSGHKLRARESFVGVWWLEGIFFQAGLNWKD